MISVIIPAYNRTGELLSCLASLERQSLSDFEVVVVDDGSNPSIDPASYKGRLKINWLRTANGGAPQARNHGFKHSRGEYILFVDQDMELTRDCLAKMKDTLDRHAEIDFVYSDFKYGWKVFRFWNFSQVELKRNNYINTCSMIRRGAAVLWDEALKRFQDWDFWLRVVAKGGRGRHIPEMLFKASVRQGTISYWLPKAAYRLPLLRHLKRVRDYEAAKRVVAEKHGL